MGTLIVKEITTNLMLKMFVYLDNDFTLHYMYLVLEQIGCLFE